jgi:3'(2'), 5'-bisphosphate nucleotidase
VNEADRAALLPDIVTLAQQASDAILKIYAGDFDVRAKKDATPVTAADEASEAIILAGLARLTPDIPAVSEEQMSRLGWSGDVPARFWLVDPLDGTREFAARNGEFSVNIGLVIDRRPVFGVLMAPVTGMLWAASGPGTATARKGKETPRPIRARKPPPEGLTALGSRSHGDKAAIEAFLAEYKVAAMKVSGSALKLGLIAEGEADIYPRFGKTMEWDTAAGHAILEAAGGRLETMAGGPLLYGKPGFRNPDFVAFGAQ